MDGKLLPQTFKQKMETTHPFAALVFIKPRSAKWEGIKALCKTGLFQEEDEKSLALFDDSLKSMQALEQIVGKISSWKSAYFFVEGKPASLKMAEHWIPCYAKALETGDRERHCFLHREFSHFNNDLDHTCKPDECASFILPCKCTGWFVRFADSIPASFYEQFEENAATREAILCPMFSMDGFKGPKCKKDPMIAGIGISIHFDDLFDDPPREKAHAKNVRVQRSALPEPIKRKTSKIPLVWKMISVFSGITVLLAAVPPFDFGIFIIAFIIFIGSILFRKRKSSDKE